MDLVLFSLLQRGIKVIPERFSDYLKFSHSILNIIIFKPTFSNTSQFCQPAGVSEHPRLNVFRKNAKVNASFSKKDIFEGWSVR